MEDETVLGRDDVLHRLFDNFGIRWSPGHSSSPGAQAAVRLRKGSGGRAVNKTKSRSANNEAVPGIQALTGISGVGKTAIAKEYARQGKMIGLYTGGVFWTDAASGPGHGADMVQDNASVEETSSANSIPLSRQATAAETRRRQDTSGRDWLVIVDNADLMDAVQYERYEHLLPGTHSRGHCLLLSQCSVCPAWLSRRLTALIEIQALALTDTAALLAKLTHNSRLIAELTGNRQPTSCPARQPANTLELDGLLWLSGPNGACGIPRFVHTLARVINSAQLSCDQLAAAMLRKPPSRSDVIASIAGPRLAPEQCGADPLQEQCAELLQAINIRIGVGSAYQLLLLLSYFSHSEIPALLLAEAVRFVAGRNGLASSPSPSPSAEQHQLRTLVCELRRLSLVSWAASSAAVAQQQACIRTGRKEQQWCAAAEGTGSGVRMHRFLQKAMQRTIVDALTSPQHPRHELARWSVASAIKVVVAAAASQPDIFIDMHLLPHMVVAYENCSTRVARLWQSAVPNSVPRVLSAAGEDDALSETYCVLYTWSQLRDEISSARNRGNRGKSMLSIWCRDHTSLRTLSTFPDTRTLLQRLKDPLVLHDYPGSEQKRFTEPPRSFKLVEKVLDYLEVLPEHIAKMQMHMFALLCVEHAAHRAPSAFNVEKWSWQSYFCRPSSSIRAPHGPDRLRDGELSETLRKATESCTEVLPCVVLKCTLPTGESNSNTAGTDTATKQYRRKLDQASATIHRHLQHFILRSIHNASERADDVHAAAAATEGIESGQVPSQRSGKAAAELRQRRSGVPVDVGRQIMETRYKLQPIVRTRRIESQLYYFLAVHSLLLVCEGRGKSAAVTHARITKLGRQEAQLADYARLLALIVKCCCSDPTLAMAMRLSEEGPD